MFVNFIYFIQFFAYMQKCKEYLKLYIKYEFIRFFDSPRVRAVMLVKLFENFTCTGRFLSVFVYIRLFLALGVIP